MREVLEKVRTGFMGDQTQTFNSFEYRQTFSGLLSTLFCKKKVSKPYVAVGPNNMKLYHSLDQFCV